MTAEPLPRTDPAKPLPPFDGPRNRARQSQSHVANYKSVAWRLSHEQLPLHRARLSAYLIPWTRSLHERLTEDAGFAGDAEDCVPLCAEHFSGMRGLTNTILLVEDSADDAFWLKRALVQANIANPVRTVRDGVEAMRYLEGIDGYADREEHPLPFLVFLDLKLPGPDGLEVLQWIRQQPNLSGMAVVILSGSEDASDQRNAYMMGARSYLLKPPMAEELTRLMKSMEIYWSRFRDQGPVKGTPEP